MTHRALVLAAALMLAPRAARAEEPPPPRWYGWELLLVDGAAVTLVAASGGSDLGYLGLGVYALGGPMVHFSHDNTADGALSLVLRVGLPVGISLAAASTCDASGGGDDEWFGCFGHAAGGFIGGALLAMAIDDLLLAREREREREPAAPRVLVAPRREGGLTVALAGSF